jgi:hypothetical protein
VAFIDESGSNGDGPILLPPPMEYRDKVEEEDGPGSVFTSSSVRSLSPTSPFTWSVNPGVYFTNILRTAFCEKILRAAFCTYILFLSFFDAKISVQKLFKKCRRN